MRTNAEGSYRGMRFSTFPPHGTSKEPSPIVPFGGVVEKKTTHRNTKAGKNGNCTGIYISVRALTLKLSVVVCVRCLIHRLR